MIEILPDGSVVIDFEGHCVQTAAKNVHRELTAALLAAEGEPRGFGEAVELLAAFLDGTDFAALRAGHPGLDGSVRGRVRVFLDGDGQARWEVPGAP